MLRPPGGFRHSFSAVYCGQKRPDSGHLARNRADSPLYLRLANLRNEEPDPGVALPARVAVG